MLKTIEAIYENGQFIGLEDQLPRTRTRVLVTILDPETKHTPKKKSTLNTIVSSAGILKSFKGDAVKYQRRIRNAW